MAYPTVSAPYGLKPVNLIGGQVFAGSTRLMEIASGYATNIFYGDLVKRISDGTIEKDTGTTTATPVGVFLGVSFTNSSTGQIQQQQFYPASQSIKSGTKIFAVVADDPDTLFQVVSCSATTTVAGMGISAIGNNLQKKNRLKNLYSDVNVNVSNKTYNGKVKFVSDKPVPINARNLGSENIFPY